MGHTNLELRRQNFKHNIKRSFGLSILFEFLLIFFWNNTFIDSILGRKKNLFDNKDR